MINEIPNKDVTMQQLLFSTKDKWRSQGGKPSAGRPQTTKATKPIYLCLIPYSLCAPNNSVPTTTLLPLSGLTQRLMHHLLFCAAAKE